MEEIHKMDLVRDSNDEWEFECDACGRTLILQKNKFEFQSGGAITFDSDPKKELAEIYSKAKSLINLLERCR